MSRPLDSLAPPADPVPFPQARYHHGKRASVLCYNPKTDKHQVVENVLLRDESRSLAQGPISDEAYWKVPFKKPIKTIMGHVEICVVLERCRRSNDEEDGSDCEESEGEDDVVFQWTSRYVAIKVNNCRRIESLKNKHAEDPLKEIAAMQLIGESHPHVLGCRQVLYDGHNINVIMRYCNSGDLFQLLQDSQDSARPGISEDEARAWFRQIISGVHHLHSIGICHRDLSPENVMMDKEAGTLIIDMGMCLRVPYVSSDTSVPTDKMTATGSGGQLRRCWLRPQGACGKLPYMAPEVYASQIPFDSAAIDVWTTGTILFCMLSGNRSYQRPESSDPQFYWMTKGLGQLLNDWDVRLSPEGLDLLQNMLQVEPRLRLTLEEVLAHPWLSKSNIDLK